MSNFSYLGVGVKYPLETSSLGRVKLVSGVDNLVQSMKRILETPVGSIFYNRGYGSHLQRLNFEPSDAVLYALIEEFITAAIEQWETRVRIVRVSCQAGQNGRVDCQVYFRVLASNEINSFVYPFYRELKY